MIEDDLNVEVTFEDKGKSIEENLDLINIDFEATYTDHSGLSNTN